MGNGGRGSGGEPRPTPKDLSSRSELPTSLRLYLILPAALLSAFVFSAPWTIAGKAVGRLTPVLGAALVLVLVAMIPSSWRDSLTAGLLAKNYQFGWHASALLFLISALFLLRIIESRYDALEVNAWDFSVYELPISAGLKNSVLQSPFIGKSFLSVHASYLLFLFVPLYALAPWHGWLLLAQALVIAGATTAAFLVCRRLINDDLAGLLIAIGYLLNTYTAKTAQYVFHVEVFYPLLLFLLAYGCLRRNPALFFSSATAAAILKEDAVLALGGAAIAGFIFGKPHLWWLAAGLIGITSFLVGTFVVMPHFAGTAPGDVWYASHWASFGSTPIRAAVGMLTHPLAVAADISRSGVKDLLESFGFLPLLGYEWLLAALPGLVVYGTADQGIGGMSLFPIYYSSPVVAPLVVGAASMVRRLGAWVSQSVRLRIERLVAIAFCLVSALDGASYTFFESSPARFDISSIRIGPGTQLFVQGAALPHLPLRVNALPLMKLAVPEHSSQTVLLVPEANPYPFSQPELLEFMSRLEKAGFRSRRFPGGTLLFSR